MKLRTRILSVLLLAGVMASATEAVYVTPHGKTFHSRQDCMSLKRSLNVSASTAAAAVARGLKACGMCARRKAVK